ncbi:MAG: hypothetical protein L6R37_004802 [Teloschistes peruensis]|nr:MAG: hypothetical protein L6R37_004802 [Teloschistes peruensis]
MFLWLALKQLDRLVILIGKRHIAAAGLQVQGRLDEVQRSLRDCRKSLNAQKVRSNILRTFIVSKEDENIISQYIMHENMATSPDDIMVGNSPMIASVNSSDRTLSVMKVGPQLAHEANSQVIASQRTIHNYNLEFQASDIAIFEAVAADFFEDSNEEISAIWPKTLDMHEELNTAKFAKPRRIALNLYFGKTTSTLLKPFAMGIQEISQRRLFHSLYDSGAFV